MSLKTAKRLIQEKQKIGRLQGIFTQCNSIMGVSIITYPYTYAQLGYVLSTCFIIFMCVISAYTLYFLAKCAKDTKLDNIDELLTHFFNKNVSFICTFLLYTACLLPLIFYLKISIDFFADILSHFGFKDQKLLVGIITTSFCFVLCILYQKVEHLDVISVISLSALFAFLVYIFYDFFVCYKYISFAVLKKIEVNYESLGSFSFIIFGFMSHNSIIPITTCIESEVEATKVIVISNLISSFLYVVIGFLGFAVHPSSQENYLLNSGGNCSIKIAIMFFLGTINIFSFPLMMITAVGNAFRLFHFYVSFTETNFLRTLNIFANILISILFVFCMKRMEILENLFFIIGSLLMFVLPVSLFIKIHPKIRIHEWFVISVSIMLAFFCIYMGLKGFYELICKES